MKAKKQQALGKKPAFDSAQPLHLIAELIEHTEQIVFVFDIGSNQFLYLNSSFELVWQVTREGAYSNAAGLLQSIHPDDMPYLTKAYTQLLADTDSTEVSFRIQRPNGSERTIRLSVFQIKSESENITLAGFGSDITEEKNYIDTLKKYGAKKNSILEILSHDLAGPLGVIQSLSSLMASKAQKKEDEQLIRLIEDTSKRSIMLIREFTKQEFLESSQVELIKVRIDLVAKVREVIDQYQLSQQDIGKTFHLVTSREKVFVEADEVKFMQVVNNLISNAIKFTPDGGIITTRIQDKKNKVILSVEDNGIGIPEHLQDGLFERFTKARRPGIKGEPSVGLGMSISKTIVEWHNGKIWFESKENKGSSFHIELPKQYI